MSRAPKGRRTSLLEDRRGGVGKALIPSAGLHALLAGAMILPGLWGITLPGCEHRPPPLLDRDIFMVEAVVLPKAKRMPKKAAAPKPPEVGKSGKKAAEPVIKDQMVLKTKDSEKKAGKERPPKEEPKKKKKKKKSRADLLASRTTETSDKPIFETSVDGDEDVTPDMALASKFGKPMSAYERRVHDRVKDNWFPKAGQSPPDPSLWAVISFDIDDSGTIAGPSVQRRSGDRIFDSSCLRSVARTSRVDAPPPDAPRRFNIRFSPEDKK